MQGLHNLVAPKGARKKAKRLGRGESSGHGKTSGRGNKGQKARKSGNVRIGFEGGQNPLSRRLPKRGFSNAKFAIPVGIVNVGALSTTFDDGAVVDRAALIAVGLLRHRNVKVKLLGTGEMTKKLVLHVDAVSESALAKVKSAGGSVELNNA